MQHHPNTLASLLRADAFRLLVRERLPHQPSDRVLRAPYATAPPRPSDFDLNPGLDKELGYTASPKAAAVLVPVVARQPLSVLFTLRTDHLTSHAGQVSFPGGKIDDHDEGATATALREAEEEIALDRSVIEPLGFLDTYHTSTGYSVAPLVSLVAADYRATPNPDEVADIFEVPLAFLMDPANISLNARMWLGRERQFYAFTFETRYIWGATAGILKNMQERLFLS